MTRHIFQALLLLFSSFTIPASAQDKKSKEPEKEKVPTYNIVIDDPMDAFGRNPEPAATLLFPAFYSYSPSKKNDTVFEYVCYDVRDSIINVDTLHDINQVRFISLWVRFTDKHHTYRDENGKQQLLPGQKIIKRYDKLGTDRWMSIDYATNKYIELKEYRNEIVRTETVTITNPLTKATQPRTHQYYKVTGNK